MNKKLNLWFTAPKGAKPVNQTSATDWQMAVQRDNVTKHYYIRKINNNDTDEIKW